MARKDKDATPEVPAGNAPDAPPVEGATDELGWTNPPDSIGRLRAEAESTARALAVTADELAKRQAKADDARAKLAARIAEDNAAAIKERRGNPMVPVVVQTKNGEPVKIGPGRFIECLKPTKVTHRELRKLDNMAKQHRIQLIVGEIQKPGAIVEVVPGDKPQFERRNEVRRWLAESKERAAVITNEKG